MSSPTNTAQKQKAPITNSGRPALSQPSNPELFSSVHGVNTSTGEPKLQTDLPKNAEEGKHRAESGTPTVAERHRSASKKLEESSLPKGIWDATATVASSILSFVDVRRGGFGSEGGSAKDQLKEWERRNSNNRRCISQTGDDNSLRPSLCDPKIPIGGRIPVPLGLQNSLPNINDDQNDRANLEANPKTHDEAYWAHHNKPIPEANGMHPTEKHQITKDLSENLMSMHAESSTQYKIGPFENGYHFPPRHTWTESIMIVLKGFWNYVTTWLGFIVVIYGLNVVAWGGMIFLLLCNAAPAMCYPTCDDINSPRRLWIEIDAQVLTALFCVTGFGLIPWRFRDLYYLLKYRLRKDHIALRRLAGIHRDWFRLGGSQNLPVLLGPENIESEQEKFPENSAPYPLTSISSPPLTGIRASPTHVWKLDYVIWMFVWNTFLQAVLSGIMWGLNRYDRPPWATGLFVALACIVAACGGIMIFVEGKKVKGVEGIPVSEKDQERLKKDRELGILHINNMNDAVPREKKSKQKSTTEANAGKQS